MRSFLSLSFIIIYGFGLLKPIAPLIEFEMNKGYIQTFLCINKTEPIVVCGGHCYLSNELKKSLSQEDTEDENHQQINLADYPIGWINLLLFKTNLSKGLLKTKAPYLNSYLHLFSSSLDKPPIELIIS